jgi:hypothetical protein
MHDDQKQKVSTGQPGYEVQEVLTLRGVLLFMIPLAAVVVLALVVSHWLESLWVAQTEKETATVSIPVTGSQLPAPPRLQGDPEKDMEVMRNQERTQLGDYGWIDQEKGLVRIPISRAIEIIGQRGLPHRGDSEDEPTPSELERQNDGR